MSGSEWGGGNVLYFMQPERQASHHFVHVASALALPSSRKAEQLNAKGKKIRNPSWTTTSVYRRTDTNTNQTKPTHNGVGEEERRASSCLFLSCRETICKPPTHLQCNASEANRIRTDGRSLSTLVYSVVV
ncbi:hypothetical protein L249_7222, partial [Ophiocordyceps polyrhachis-furcata BCC 54312]